jgi:hypothetical protein
MAVILNVSGLFCFLLVLCDFFYKRQIPPHLDWFGWCTWDAFYKDVNPVGIEEGLQRYTRIEFVIHLQILLCDLSSPSFLLETVALFIR